MEDNYLMLPLQKMMENSPLLSKCLKNLSFAQTKSDKSSAMLLQNGLNSLDHVGDIFTITITNEETGYTSTIRIDKKEHQGCSAKFSSIIVVVVVLLLVVLVGCAVIGVVMYKKKKNSQNYTALPMKVNLAPTLQTPDQLLSVEHY